MWLSLILITFTKLPVRNHYKPMNVTNTVECRKF